MTFLPAPEYPVFAPEESALGPHEAVVRAARHTRGSLAGGRFDAVVHDILTLAPALAAELEGISVATLIPHLYPVGARGFPPYALGARPPRTQLSRRFWTSLERPLEAG